MSSQSITILGYATVEEKHHELFTTLATRMVTINRTEQGCLQSLILRDMKHNNNFVLHEVWEDSAAWIQHIQQQHVFDFIEQSKDLGTGLTIHKFSTFGLPEIEPEIIS